jgi:hypothetical protein
LDTAHVGLGSNLRHCLVLSIVFLEFCHDLLFSLDIDAMCV